jgi:hypothetical protein
VLAYGLYAVICLLVCWRTAHLNRFLGLYFAGLLLLPNQNYSLSWQSQNPENTFPYWHIGGALASEIFLTKAFVVPSCLALGLLLFKYDALKKLRFTAFDVCLILWLGISALSSFSNAVYFTGVWGGTWVLGRTLFQSKEDVRFFAWSLVFSAAIFAPLALVEMICGPFLYESLYGPHPFTLDGAVRYIGFRPMLMFEHGNQYGFWVGAAAISSFWILLASADDAKRYSALKKFICLVPILLCLASQSIGAIALVIAACIVLRFWPHINTRKTIITLFATVSISIMGFASSAIRVEQIEQIARNTTSGQKAIGFFRSIGRNSLPWRISQDFKALSLVKGSALTGLGNWDWWRPSGTRPWGLHQLIFGQFGLFGFVLSFLTLGMSSLRVVWRFKAPNGFTRPLETQFIAVLVVTGMFDALLNSFIFYPMILISAALVANK